MKEKRKREGRGADQLTLGLEPLPLFGSSSWLKYTSLQIPKSQLNFSVLLLPVDITYG